MTTEEKLKLAVEALRQISAETFFVSYDTGFDSPWKPTAGARKAQETLAQLEAPSVDSGEWVDE